MAQDTNPTLNALIGIIERNQQSLGQVGLSMESQKNEILSNLARCHVECNASHDAIVRIADQLVESVQQSFELISQIKEALVIHCNEIARTDLLGSKSILSTIMNDIKELKDNNDSMVLVLKIMTTLVGIFSAIMLSVAGYLMAK